MNRTKFLITTLFSVLISVIELNAQNNFYIEDFSIEAGETKVVSIILDNQDALTGFEADLYLPEGLILDGSVINSERVQNNAPFYSTNIKKDEYGVSFIKLACMSFYQEAFKGNTGALVDLTITATDTFSGTHEICLKNIIFTDANANEYALDSTTAIVSCKVVPTLAESITLDMTTVSLRATETIMLVATILPETTANKSVTWNSSNESVAIVDENGVVTAIAVGEATISATTTDGSDLSASCKVTVVPTLAETITLDKTEISLEATETATLVATVLSELTTNKSVTWKSSNEAVAIVDANGKVTAVAVGEATITATTADGSNKSATCKITVAKTLASSISLDKTSATLKATETLTLKATVAPATTTNKSVTWKSSNEAVATVDANGKVTAVAVGETTITATTTDGSNKSATCKITVAKTLAESVTLDKTTATLKATETLTLKATIAPATTTDKSVTWKSSNEAVATVDANGKVTAVAVGEATITVTTTDGSNKSATCKITVAKTLATSISLDKTSATLKATETLTLKATVAPATTTDKSVTWKSSNEAVATVDANGKVTAVAVGEATITATTTDGSNLSATCKVTVVATLAESITLNVTEASLKVDGTTTLTATVLPEATTNKSVTWTSSNEAVATVDANGKVTAIAVGEATITATTADGSNLSTSCVINVGATPAESISLNLTEASLKVDETTTLTATVLPENATNKSVTWKSSNEAVATVDANGKVTAVAVGEATITVTTTDGSNKSATCKITVAKTLAESVTLDKTSATLKATETLTLKATIAPATTTNKSVTWKSSNEAVATVDANGKVTAVAVGETTITATTTDGSNLSATCKVTVVATLAESITLNVTEASLKVDGTTTLTATVLPEATTNKSVTWTSTNEYVAIVDANGKVTAVSVGEAIITATTTDSSNLSASCKVIVNPTLATSITLDKTEVELEATQTATLVATVIPELATNKSVTWSSSNESVATVDENGVVTAIAVGEATITATTTDGSNLTASCKVIVNPTLATSIALDKSEVELEATQTATLVATVLPELTTNNSVTWSSSNENVATVDENGKVTAIKVGEATITATTTDGSNLSATCKVTVIPTLVVSIEVTPNVVEAEENSEVQLSVIILPEDATCKSVEWSSSNDAIASVDANGLVTMHSAGDVIITATTTDGTNLSATCHINVYSGIERVDAYNVVVATIGDNIVVKNARNGGTVNVYASNGALVKSVTATDGSVVIDAPMKGIYVVVVDGKSFKVMVK